MSDNRSTRLNIYKIFHNKSSTDDFVDLPVGPHASVIRYQYDTKNPADDQKKPKGNFGIVSFYRRVGAASGPEWVVGKFFVSYKTSSQEMKNEAIHTAINLGWAAHNFVQLNMPKVLFQPMGDGELHSDIIFSTPSAFFASGARITDAVIAYHADNHVHRDIKTNNILFSQQSGQALLIDSGLSQFFGERSFCKGKSPHQPPELPSREIPLHLDVDIWGLGEAFNRDYFKKLHGRHTSNTFLARQLRKLCSEMKAFEPSERLSLVQVKQRIVKLEKIAKLTEDEKIVQSSVNILELFPNIKSFLEFHFSLSVNHQDRLLALTGETCLRQIIVCDEKDEAANDLIHFLKTKDLKTVTLQYLKNVLKFYPKCLHHALLEKIGVDTLKKVVSQNKDSNNLLNELLVDALPMPFTHLNVGAPHEFFQVIESFFHLFLAVDAKKFPQKVIHPCKVKIVTTITKQAEKAQITPSCLDALESKSDLDEAALSRMNRDKLCSLMSGLLLEEEVNYPFKFFASTRKNYFDLIHAIECNIHPNTLFRKLVGIGVSSYFLESQYELKDKNFDQANEWSRLLVYSFQDFQDFLEFDLDLAPVNRPFLLMRCCHYLEAVRKNFLNMPKAIEHGNFLDKIFSHYYNSNLPFSNFILNVPDLLSLIQIYPERSRLKLLEKVGIAYIHRLLNNNRVNFREIFELLPPLDNRKFMQQFDAVTLTVAPQMLFPRDTKENTKKVLTLKEQGLAGRVFVK